MMEKIVISGVTSGFGIEWLYDLDSENNVEFFVLARSKNKFISLVKERPLKNKYHFIACDFSSLKSIEAAKDKISSISGRVDLLINNAGVWSSDEITFSEDGVEETFAVNQLAPYVLTGHLLPLLRNSEHPRIVNTASFRHSDAKVDKNDIELKRNFNAEIAYCNSKLYSILFTKHLAKLLSGSVAVNCFDPGIVDTPMLKKAFPKKISFLYPFVRKFIARTPKKGAETGVFLSGILPDMKMTGEYFKDNKIKAVSALGNDESLAEWLWNECKRVSGFSYPGLIK